MFDPKTEKLIPFADVPDLPWLPRRRGGAKLAVNSVHRWATKGILEFVQVGSTRCTTEAAVLRCFESLGKPVATPATPCQRRKAQLRAAAILDAAGI